MKPSLVLAASLLLGAMPAAAQQVACLNDSDKKVCVQLIAQPDKFVQASQLNGADDTFVFYTAQVSNVTLPSSSRNLDVSFTLSPAVDIVDFTASGAGSCTVTGAQLDCRFDKLETNNSTTITLTAKAPVFAGSATPTTLVNTGVFGWNGRTATVSNSLPVSTSGGYTWVPPNTSVTLVTAPESGDPATQTTPEDPLWAKMVIPALPPEPDRPNGFEAYLAINSFADENLAAACPGGLFVSGNSDGGPYVCRDIGAPHDAGNPTRWVEHAIDEYADGDFSPSDPVRITLIWDDTIVASTQLAPTPAMPHGTPPLAMFYRAGQGDGEDHPIRAYAKACGAAPQPCVSDVQNFATNDWTATLQTTLVDNGGAAADPLLPPSVLGALQDVLDGLMGVADATLLPDKPIMK